MGQRENCRANERRAGGMGQRENSFGLGQKEFTHKANFNWGHLHGPETQLEVELVDASLVILGLF